MTDREAIAILSECRYCENKEVDEDGEIECLGDTKCFFAHANAISALKEREEQSKGCQVCNAEWWREQALSCNTRYCFNCGRKLKGAQDEH